MIKVQRRNIKKNRIMVCFSLLLSVILSVSAPFSITSNASAIGIPLGISVDSYLASFYSFLLGHGYVPDSITNPFTADRVDPSAISDVISFYDELNSYKEGLGDEVESAILSGTLDGKFLLSEEGQKDFVEYLQLTGAIPLFSNRVNLPLNPAGSISTITINYRAGSSPTVYTDTITITSNQPYLILLENRPLSDGYYRLFQVLNLNGTSSSVSINKGNTAFNPSYASSFPNMQYTKSDGNTFVAANTYYRATYNYNGSPYFNFESCIVNAVYFNELYYSSNIIADILYNMIHDGEAWYDSTSTASSFVGTQEVVSSTSTVSDEGVIEGPFSGVVIPLDTLAEMINAIKSGVLTIKDALRSIGLNTVESNATSEEKEQAISNIIEVVPSTSITDIQVNSTGITESESKVGTLTHIEHSIANAIAQITGRELPYPDEDPNVGPTGQPYIEDWTFPSLDPSDPNPGGSQEESEEDRNRAGDVAAAIPVVAGLASDIFDSASGFNLVTTIGYSLVIFSAILGASHFFGALGGRHDDVRHPLDWDRSSERWSSKRTDFKSDW